MSTAGEAKLREWARELQGMLGDSISLAAEYRLMVEAGESLIRQCAEIARRNSREGSISAYIENETADAILREFGMEGK